MSENETDGTTPAPEPKGPAAKADDQQATAATAVKAAKTATPESEAAESAAKLSELMASGDAPAKEGNKKGAAAARPDLDAEAMRAAQEAIAEGERALAAARAQLGTEAKPVRARAKRREFALRMLLGANVLAMLVVVGMPGGPATEPAPVVEPVSKQPVKPQPKTPVGPRLADKYNQAMVASEGGQFAKAITLLEEYLDENPRMVASSKVNVYRAIAHYSGAIGRIANAQAYERRAQEVTQSHRLPEDLVAMAKAAAENNDQESLRQVWARFLLQQRQIPSSLYQHVAEAYLQLGDSYRSQANEAAERARLAELRRADELLRQQGKGR